ncbi:MAG: hypothetical protein RML95_03950 [Anaerolineae bacterium]|nr:hypothetical protein [Anaerolineae bacterium]MDW8298471.1 hypothetical protein [Anaerolineae bacterium]
MRSLVYFSVYWLISALGALLLSNLYEPEANYALYRFAVNFAEGRGLLYGTPIGNVTTFPLAPTLLAALFQLGVEPSLGSFTLNSVATALGALCLALWLNKPLFGALYALLMLIQPSPMLTVMLALALFGALMLWRDKPLLAGLSLGLATLSAPYAVIIALMLAFAAAAQSWSAWRRFALPAAALPISVGLVIQLTYAPVHIALPLPDLSRIAYNAELDEPPAAAQIGMWLAEQTTPDALIAANDAVLIGYHALPRPILDLDSYLMPVERNRFLMIRYAPDVVVLRAGESVGWDNFATTYAQVYQVGNLSVYQRVVNWSALDDHGVDVNLSARLSRQDMRLVNVGIGRTLRRGDLVRVRLDWQLQFVPRQTVEIRLNLLGANGIPVAGIIERLAPEVWQTGAFSTYHAMLLPANTAEGELRLFLSVDINAAELINLQVARVRCVP